MLIPLAEPTSPWYIYINPKNNLVHLMMPVVSGREIGLDNTCKSVYALQEFFGKSEGRQQITVLNELLRYKAALVFDISLLTDLLELDEQEKKQERLDQINQYVKLITKIQSSKALNTLAAQWPDYPEPLKKLMREKNTNLYSMVLRPTAQDSYLRSINPVFSVKRTNDVSGNPNSLFYSTLHDVYQRITLAPLDARARLTVAVASCTEGQRIDFEGIQQALSQKAQELLGVVVDFTKTNEGAEITKAFIDTTMGFIDSDTPVAATDYVDALIGYCTPTLFETLLESPFYTIKTAEALSIITQFFLASVNIYCRSNDLSSTNFGQVLDTSVDLSTEVAARVLSALSSNTNIEESLLDFVNEHQDDLKLKQALTPEDMDIIKKKFTDNYTEIKDSPHFDEFMVFDSSKPGLFINHQGDICTDFCEFLAAGLEKSFFVQKICKDFKAMHGPISHKNEWITSSIELNIEKITNIQLAALLEKLPKESRQQIIQSNPERMMQLQPIKIVPELLHCVARGQQQQAERLLARSTDAQSILLSPSAFTDYCGRTFNSTCYEYAYWAKDTHMCRMLERYMDDATKAKMLARIDEIERIDAATGQPVGLVYSQGDREHRSAHFNLTALVDALQRYVDGHDNWKRTNNLDAMKAAWLEVGILQRDMPVHVLNEYCYPRRPFYPRPEFNEETLPRSVRFYNFNTFSEVAVFPLLVSDIAGLGIDFSLVRGVRWSALGGQSGWGAMSIDLVAISHLDEIRTADLMHSRMNLQPTNLGQSHSMRVRI